MDGTRTRVELRRLRIVSWLVAGLVVIGCSGDDGTGPDPRPEPEPEEPAEVNGYVASLGSWEDYAPPVPDTNAVAGDSSVVEETVQEPDIEGVLQNVTYQCTETPYSLTSTPAEIVMYEPNASVMWVGSLIQGKSYKGGQGTFAELPIRQRNPLQVTIDLLTDGNSATVTNPTSQTVQAAIGELIQRATDRNHRAGSSIFYEEMLSHSVEQSALELGLSARYLGTRAKGELSVQRSANQRTLVAHFVQKMFTISMVLPQTPADMFSDELTQALWNQQVAAGNVGPDNLPVYVAQITYGRTLTYSLTSSHSESRMRAAISASYNGVAGGASGYTEAQLRETLSQQNLRATAIGGEGQNVLDLISEGNLKAYFREDSPLTAARPISYQLNFLGNNDIAKVAETTAYTRRECSPKAASGGRFDFAAIQQGPAPVPTPYTVLHGDLNDDGRGDLVWSHLTSGTNVVAVGFGGADGSFDIRSSVTHPATPAEGWSNGFRAHVGDFDGDGSDDLVFNRSENSDSNVIYLALSRGDGTFDHRERITHAATGWQSGWRTMVGDLNGDGADDLVWNLLLSTGNYTWIALSNGDGTFTYGARQVYAGTGWNRYVAALGDVDGDRREDLIWNTVGTHNRVYVGHSDGDGTYTGIGPSDVATTDAFAAYTLQTGDVNRDGRTDLVWTDLSPTRDPTPIHRALGQSTSRWSLLLPYVSVARPEDAGVLAPYMGDFNGDGGSDLLWNELAAGKNKVWIGLGNVDGGFDFTPLPQEHPASQQSEDWTAFNGGVLVVDVNGDGRDDVVWNERGATNRIYVALARGSGG